MAYDRKQGKHEVAQSSRPDYRLEVGRAEVPVGKPRGFTVLDPARAKTLTAWTSTLIPSAGTRPDAGSVGAAEYIDATVHLVPSLRPALIAAIDRVEEMALERSGRSFAECSQDEREQILREFSAADDSDAFGMINDFVYEAYYGNLKVLTAIEKDTGWRSNVPMTGTVMKEFDETRLNRVRSMPAHFTEARSKA